MDPLRTDRGPQAVFADDIQRRVAVIAGTEMLRGLWMRSVTVARDHSAFAICARGAARRRGAVQGRPSKMQADGPRSIRRAAA